ncbi:MAG TPA: NADPH-dependent oxidoreductase [Methylocystis sp.]|nr:NADPH-dependent oxidoreductase [Methylocystis sp.]
MKGDFFAGWTELRAGGKRAATTFLREATMHDKASESERAAAAIFARYRRNDAPRPVEWNETLDIILRHRSHRAFLPEKLPEGALETIVAAAQSASTSSNLQVWSVVAVEDKDRKARLAELAGGQQHVRDCATFLIWLSDLARLENLARREGREAKALPYLELFLTGVVDAALAAQNAVTALESLGLGCVYIGAMRNHPEEVAKELDLPPNVFAVFGMAVGVPDPAVGTDVKPRLGQAAVLHREQYAWGEAQLDAVDTLDVKFRDFQREQGLPEQGWIRQVLSRVRGPEAMSGRDRLREALAALGVALR